MAPASIARSSSPGLVASLRMRIERRPRPWLARRALKKLLANPDDTAAVFTVIRALSGSSFERLVRRVRKDPIGAVILREQRDLIPVLSDQAYLDALPTETLGHQYGRFIRAESISSQGLADASMVSGDAVGVEVDPEAAAFGARLRDMHDLWHIVTGYSRDILGELALLAFTHQQTGNPGIGYIVRTVERRMSRGGNPEIGEFLRHATERGRNAAFLPAADWEALLETPLDEVRRVLNVGEPVQYEQRRTAEGEAAAAAASA